MIIYSFHWYTIFFHWIRIIEVNCLLFFYLLGIRRGSRYFNWNQKQEHWYLYKRKIFKGFFRWRWQRIHWRQILWHEDSRRKGSIRASETKIRRSFQNHWEVENAITATERLWSLETRSIVSTIHLRYLLIHWFHSFVH